MADVFISYATVDRPQAERLARALDGEGFEVWWDVKSLRSGQSFNQAIQQALAQTKCVVALWSGASVKSKWVESEAYWAWDHNKLHSVRLDDAVSPPVPYNTIHARSLASWDGSTDSPEFQRLSADIAAMVGRPRPEPESQPSPQLGTAQQPAEPKATPRTPVHRSGQPKRGVERQPNGPAAPVSSQRHRLLIAIGMSVLGGVVALIALTVYLRMGGLEPELGADSLTEAPVERRRDAASKPGEVAEPTRQAPDTFRDCADCPEVAVIPAGEFEMGCVSGKGCEDNELPVHTVTFDKPFAIGKYEVTFAEYDRFAAATGAKQPDDQGRGRGRRPVIDVSWHDAVAYAKWLSKRTGKRYRLPSEAEWEYAARGGTTKPFSSGECIDTDQANYDGNYGWEDCPKTGVYRDLTVEAGTLPANPRGLHEVHGNVWEWVQDCWHASYQGTPTDGWAWQEADGGNCGQRVVRGGSWDFLLGSLRSAFRFRLDAVSRNNNLGFRLAQDL